MPLLLPRKLSFLHLGKTGGTFVRAALLQLARQAVLDVLIDGHRMRLETAVMEQDRAILFGIRHPFEIFVSGFWSRERKGQPQYYSEWSSAEARAFGAFGTPNELAEALNDSDDARREAARDAMSAISHVSRNLSYFLHDPERVRHHVDRIFFVFDLPNLDRDIEVFYSLFGQYVPDEIRESVELRHRNPQRLDRGLSQRAVENLTVHYRNDIEIFEVCLEIRHAKLAELGKAAL